MEVVPRVEVVWGDVGLSGVGVAEGVDLDDLCEDGR